MSTYNKCSLCAYQGPKIFEHIRFNHPRKSHFFTALHTCPYCNVSFQTDSAYVQHDCNGKRVYFDDKGTDKTALTPKENNFYLNIINIILEHCKVASITISEMDLANIKHQVVLEYSQVKREYTFTLLKAITGEGVKD